jgi:quercetin dioxygenase-like cupin family protein
MSAVIRSMSDVGSIEVARCKGASIQVLLGPDDGVPNFHTRRFTIEPGGWIPLHMHPSIEHEQVVLEGELSLKLDGEERVARAGDCVYIPAGCWHAYRNDGEAPVRFLCMVPATADYGTEYHNDG